MLGLKFISWQDTTKSFLNVSKLNAYEYLKIRRILERIRNSFFTLLN